MSNSNQPPGKPPVKTLFGVGAPVLQQSPQEGAQQPTAQPPPGSAPVVNPGQTVMGMPGPAMPGNAPAPGAPPIMGQPPIGQPPVGQQSGQPPVGQPPMGQPPMGQPYGQPPMGQPPMGQPYGQPPMDPQYGHPGMANLASRLPSSKPGTVFGIPLATLRDQNLENKALTFAGILLLVSIVIPVGIKGKTRFVWDGDTFEDLVWPIIAGLSYLLVAFSPENLRRSVPPVIMKWLPFGMAFASIVILNRLFPFVGDSTEQWFANVGYAFLLFALLATMANPDDQIARILIGVGAGMMLIPWLHFVFDVAFEFKGRGAFLVIHNLLQMLVFTVAVACGAFVLKPETVPALRGVDAFKPLVTAMLLLWLPVKVVLLMLFFLTKMEMGADALFLSVHWLIGVFAYFGILMLTAPEAYDELVKLFSARAQAYTQTGPYGPGPYGQQPGQQPGVPQQAQQPGYPQQVQQPQQPQQQPGYPQQVQQPQQGGPATGAGHPPGTGYPPGGGGQQGGSQGGLPG